MRYSKYNAERTTVNGQTFDSKGEAARHQDLELLQRSGQISNLERQPKFTLQPKFTDNTGKNQRAITYKADWSYIEDGQEIIEDFKGMETKEFLLKAKMFRYQHPELILRITTKEDIK